ncbi:hypothetical protein B0H34DRAFT_732058 [Crassisporium funariophilum]|nr:hypothetical protein B0H34DRAFT_732058 [Crassisporium funariophilum]
MSYTYIGSHGQEPSETLVGHSRNMSTISSATLQTSTTLHSQPNEPLLRPMTPRSAEYYDVRSHQSRSSDRSLALPRWSQSRIMSRRPSAVDEKRSYSERNPRRRVKVLRWTKNAVEFIMMIWAIYNTARYLLAFYIYDSTTGQAFSLALGICAGLSFVFASCARILSVAQPKLLMHGISVKSLFSLRSTLHYLASCCLISPSIVNFVLVFVWKKTTDLQLMTKHRCRLDIDLLWSPSYALCNHKNRTWGSWVTLSAIRLLVTLSIIITFHLIASSSHFVPVRRLSKQRFPGSKKSHSRLDSYQAPPMTSDGNSNASIGVPHLDRDQALQKTSDVTSSIKSSPRNRLHPARSRSSAFSEEVLPSEAPSYNNPNFLPMNSDHLPESDREINGFVDRFRSLITQITRETEEGLAFARSDDASSSHYSIESPHPQPTALPELDVETARDRDNEHYSYDDDDDFYAAPNPPFARESSYQYQQAYPEDEHIRMMNGYIRRMPTIESMGSHELRGSVAASSLNRDRERLGATPSRPPTRNARVSWADTDFSGYSEPRSRSNSLTAQAELLVGMFNERTQATELGELNTIRMVDSPSTNMDSSEEVGEGEGYGSTTSSRETFLTASSGGTVNSLTRDLADASASPFSIPPHLQSPEKRGQNTL